MKDTFKTFPSKHGVDPVEWCILAEDWKERVEKELREIYNNPKDHLKAVHVKEILGE